MNAVKGKNAVDRRDRRSGLRGVACLLSATIVAALVASCGGGSGGAGGAGNGTSGNGPGLYHITLGVNVPIDFNLMLPQYVARDRGFFKQEGLQVKTVTFQGGADAVKALVAGSIDLDAATGLDAPAAVAKGAPLKGFAGGISQSTFRLVASNSSGVNSLREMKGKKIGITKFGSLTDFVARREGNSVGLKSGEDFKEVPLGASAIPAALKKGEIDLANVNPVNLFPLLDTGKVHVVTKFSKVDPNTQFVILIAKPDYLSAHNGKVKAFLRAYYKAIEYVKKHRSYGIKATMESFGNCLLDAVPGARGFGEVLV